MYGSVASGKATEPVESSFFVNLKKGDKITFEMDAYTSNRNSSAGSVWNKVYVLTTADGEKPFSEQDAVNSGLYYNPYKSGDFTNLKSLLEEVNLFIKMSDFGDELGKYSVSVKQSVDDYILNIVNDLIEDDNVNQKQVDECYNTLNNLFAELKSSGHFTIVTDNIDDVYRFHSGYYFIRLTGSDLYITTPNEYVENNIRNSVSLQPLDVL